MNIHLGIIRLITCCLLLLFAATLQGQNPERFKKEVDSLVALNKSFNTSDVILFTGSSSIRLWDNLKTAFPKHNVLNLGFGGSEMADLLYYSDRLIIPFRPIQIFIYEGDNDIASGRSVDQIISSAVNLLLRVREHLPTTEVVFISAKPSMARWHLKEKYQAFNTKLKTFAAQKNVRYADVWSPMVDSNGAVLKDIFVEDGLHLNDKGYTIWENTLRRFLLSGSR